VSTLEGKAALVTGGSRGIGRAIVKRLAADGASVVFSCLSRHDAAQSLVAEVTGDGGQAYAVQADQGSLADLRRLAAEVQQRCGGLDIVVINAASGVGQLIEEVTEESYDAYMAVHAKGPFFLLQYAGRPCATAAGSSASPASTPVCTRPAVRSTRPRRERSSTPPRWPRSSSAAAGSRRRRWHDALRVER
jgi:NAD(P)-dependent dehydrogenase (short-subunit alcohol dehydrogenase family)